MTKGLRDEFGLFLLAVQFLTRIPIPKDTPYSDNLLISATKYYPLVGIMIGAIGAAVLGVSAQVLPISVAVLLSLAATIFATGAFHEDGLADAADGLGGGLTRERSLEIMRDSRIGTYGAVTLGTALAIKVAALMSFSVPAACAALVFGHSTSRAVSVGVIFTSAYAREDAAKFVVPTVTANGAIFAFATGAITFVATLVVFGFGAFTAVAAMAALALFFRRMFLRKLGGYTGDCLGGTQQLAEIGFYLGLLAWL